MGLFGICQRGRSWCEVVKYFVGGLLGWRFVETIDGDGEVRLRRLYRNQDGRFTCRGIVGWCALEPDGTVYGPRYVKRWREVPRNV